MNRRQLLKGLAALPVAGAAVAVAAHLPEADVPDQTWTSFEWKEVGFDLPPFKQDRYTELLERQMRALREDMEKIVSANYGMASSA